MALPKGPFKRIEFIPPEKLAQGQRGKIIIHAEPAIEIEPESLYYYLLIQIVAESQKKYAKEFAKGVSPDVVLHYLKQINETLVVPRKIKKPGSLKHAWRKHIRKGTQFTFYSYNKSGKKELELELLDKASFMNNQFTPAEKVSGELPFKINIINPRRLIFRHKLLSTLKPHREAGETEPESVSIIEKYIQSLSTDFKIRNISFFGDYKDMLSDEVYIPREFVRQGHTFPDFLDMYTPDVTASDFYQLLVKNRRIIIEGEPGSGKTILLRNIALTLATNFERDRLIPLYVELRGYDRAPNQRLDDYAVEIAGTNAGFTQEEKSDFAKSIRENEANLVFLLDGYDEAGNNPEIVKQKLLSLSPSSKTVITSRKYSSTIGLVPDLRLELKPFDRPSQRLFVENAARVFGIQESGKDRLVMHIWGSSSFSDMAQNPFFLLCICFVGRAGNDTPSRRIELLRQVQVRLLDHFLNKISTNSQDVYRVIKYLRNITRNGATIFDSIYSRLAFHHFSRHELEFSEASIVNLVEAVAREYNVSQYRFELCNAVLNCGLLVTGSFQNSYSFVHPLFMEYYAAQELTRTPQWKEFVLNNYLDPSWRNVIRFFIAQSEVAKFPDIYELLTCHDDYFYNGLLLIAESISEMPEYPSETEEIIDTFCRIADRHYLQGFLIWSLFKREFGLNFVPAFGDSLTRDRHLTRLVVESLIKRGTVPCLDKCVELLLPSSNWNSKLAQLVAHYGKQITPEIIADTLLKNDDEKLREQCASALGLMPSEPAEAKLIECLLRDKDDLRRRNAAFTVLKKSGSVRSVEAFMRVLANDRDDPDIRADCADALGCWRARQAVSTLVAILLKPTDHKEVRLTCIVALREFGEPQTQAAFMHTLIHETDFRLRGACIHSLFGSESAVDKLVEILSNPKEHQGVRIACAWAFRRFRNRKPVNKLIEVLADQSDDGGVRYECAVTLGTIASEKDAEAIAEVLSDTKEDRFLRGACADALGKIHSARFVSNLVEILTNENDAGLQRNCARALASIDQNLAKDILITQLDNPNANSELRTTCITLLREIGSPQVDKLLALLRDPGCDKRLREACIEEVGELRMRQTLPELTQLLSHDHDERIRELCARALGKIGSDESIEELKEEALTSDNFGVRYACVKAIGAIGSQLAASALLHIVSEDLKRNEPNRLFDHDTLPMIPTETSLHILVLMFRKKVEEMRENLPNQPQPKFDHKQRWLLWQIQTFALQLHRIVSPQSLGLRDVIKE